MILAKRLGSYVGPLGAVVTIGALLATIYFAPERLHWVTFLAGILTAAVLAMVVRVSRAEWFAARRAAQLVVTRAKLAREVQLRERAEAALASTRHSAQHLDDALPVMILYVDSDRVVRFHNRALRDWLGPVADRLDGHQLREVFGAAAHAEIVEGIVGALDAQMAIGEATVRLPNGQPLRLAAQYLPHYGDRGKVVGAFALLTDITAPKDLRPAVDEAPVPVVEARALYVNAIAEDLTGWRDVPSRLRAALDDNEFCLYCQPIVPVAEVASPPPFYEILIRLADEERDLMPPGVFLQLAEEHGLLPDLDRWVVRHVLDFACSPQSPRDSIYAINVAGPTLSDKHFVAFVTEQLRKRAIWPFTLCFEFPEVEAVARTSDTARFVHGMGQAGCRTSMSGFGRSLGSFDLLKLLPVDYLKIDAGIVLGMLRGPVEIAKVKAINRVAHAAGMATIAECVETQETLELLRGLQVDFAQGYQIEHPKLLASLATRAVPAMPRAAA